MTAPKAIIQVNHTSGIAPLGTAFVDISTGDVEGRVWSFGDGATSAEKNAHHEYLPGDWNATLTVWNKFGSSSASVQIAVSQADEPAPFESEATLMDLVPAVRRLLRGISDQKLHYTVIVETLLDILRGYARDLDYADIDSVKDEYAARLAWLGNDDFLLIVPNANELEVRALYYERPDPLDSFAQISSPLLNSSPPIYSPRVEVPIVPLSYYHERNQRETPLAAVYAGLLVEQGTKLRINLNREMVESVNWRVQTRIPLLQTITMTSPLAMRSDFLRMLKIETAIKVMPQIRDDSESFIKWKTDARASYLGELGEWRERWKDFLKDDNKPQFAPKIPANEYRRAGYYRRNYTIERRRS